MTSGAFSIQPVAWEDMARMARIARTSFEGDANTEVKGYGRKPYNMEEVSLQILPAYIKNPRIAMIKAVDNESGELMGYAGWGFRGLPPPFEPPPTPPESETTAKPSEEETKEEPPADSIARLETLTSDHLNNFCDTAMPEGARCLFICSLTVAPEHQRRGVGAALLKWGTDIMDAHGLYGWVHSSEGAWKTYEKAGFKVNRVLDVDLDEYAPVPAPAGRYKDGKWGHYVFRYMVYGPTPPWLVEGAD